MTREVGVENKLLCGVGSCVKENVLKQGKINLNNEELIIVKVEEVSMFETAETFQSLCSQFANLAKEKAM